MSSIYIILAHRWGRKDNHTYLVGVYDNFDDAKNTAMSEYEYRGGKYGIEIRDLELNTTESQQAYYIESNSFGLAGRGIIPADKNKTLQDVIDSDDVRAEYDFSEAVREPVSKSVIKRLNAQKEVSDDQ